MALGVCGPGAEASPGASTGQPGGPQQVSAESVGALLCAKELPKPPASSQWPGGGAVLGGGRGWEGAVAVATASPTTARSQRPWRQNGRGTLRSLQVPGWRRAHSRWGGGAADPGGRRGGRLSCSSSQMSDPTWWMGCAPCRLCSSMRRMRGSAEAPS